MAPHERLPPPQRPASADHPRRARRGVASRPSPGGDEGQGSPGIHRRWKAGGEAEEGEAEVTDEDRAAFRSAVAVTILWGVVTVVVVGTVTLIVGFYLAMEGNGV